jgi:hypothetical protein
MDHLLTEAGAEQPFLTCQCFRFEWLSQQKFKQNKFAGQEGLLCARRFYTQI